MFQIPPEETADAVKTALHIGYRHIDTTAMYPNERGVGQGIRDAGLDLAERYITSKLNNGCHRPDDARRAFDHTLMALSTDYVDLFPIHWPLPTPYDGDFVSTWQTLEGFKNEATGRTPAQVVLRWHIQRGDIVFPKSVTPQRVRENFALFDFELTDSDIDALTGLDNGEAGQTGPNPDRFDYIPR